ncbi:MAG: hypothetical protein L6Q54_09580 [Leptospiraceae bacterium]|nr:hypothetical protein [Leptospiraceae bacterium]MCK6381479.1 hypothetical protein [Leptospiraceae bacterium]NUM40194.1 hypothetical protein [Leptospiraceae bacterium]
MLFPEKLPDFFSINPFDLFLKKIPTHHLEKDNYRVTLNLNSLNKVIQTEVVEKTDNLKKLTFDSENGKLNLEGYYSVLHYPLARLWRVSALNFYAILDPVWVKNNIIRFKVVSFRLENHKKKKFDLIRLLSRFDFFHRRMILESIVEVIPEVLSSTRLNNEIKFNINYFLEKIPSIAGKISISRIYPYKGEIFFYVRSSTILRALLDFFGPEFIRLDEIDEGSDSLKLLWRR